MAQPRIPQAVLDKARLDNSTFEANQFTRSTMQDGLPSDNVNQILEVERGGLWLGTANGIARASKSELNLAAKGTISFVRFTTYGKADGLTHAGMFGRLRAGAGAGLARGYLYKEIAKPLGISAF